MNVKQFYDKWSLFFYSERLFWTVEFKMAINFLSIVKGDNINFLLKFSLVVKVFI